jgi:hypothetical protein
MPNNSFKNRFQKLLSLLLCAAILCGGFALARGQSATLADGDPPLTASMVERYVNLME